MDACSIKVVAMASDDEQLSSGSLTMFQHGALCDEGISLRTPSFEDSAESFVRGHACSRTQQRRFCAGDAPCRPVPTRTRHRGGRAKGEDSLSTRYGTHIGTPPTSFTVEDWRDRGRGERESQRRRRKTLSRSGSGQVLLGPDIGHLAGPQDGNDRQARAPRAHHLGNDEPLLSRTQPGAQLSRLR